MNTTSLVEPLEVDVQPVLAAILPSHSPSAPETLGRTMGAAFGALQAFVECNHLTQSGPPRAIYKSFDSREMQFVVAVPVETPTGFLDGEADITVRELPGGKWLRFTHRGPYANLRTTYEGISSWMAGAGLLESEGAWVRFMPLWEEYLNDTDATAPDDLITQIYIPLAHAKV
jgi:effector-binding domain-containing protein